MIKSLLKIAPGWIETEEPEPHADPLRQLIANKFYEIGKRQGHQFLPSVSGALSSTFSYPVFAMPHLDAPLRLHGFLSAFRPIDCDEGTHLVAFGQYYICTNVPFADRFQFIREVIHDVIRGSFPSDIGLTEIKIEEGCEDWKADSTGYRGGGSEINVTSIMLDGKEHKIGRLELAQINDYNFSGNIEGKLCHLIVFGIDRLTNLCAIIKAIKERGDDYVAHMPIHELYMMEEKEAALHKGLIDILRSTPTNGDTILSSIHEGLSDIEQALEKSKFTSEVFLRLGQISSLAECAYAANVVTRNYRQYLIHRFSQLYARFSKDIVAHPQIHLQTIEQSISLGKRCSLSAPSIFDILMQPFLKRHFSVAPRASERKVRGDLIPQSLIDFFWDEEIIGGIKLPSSRTKELEEQSQFGTQEPLEMRIRNEKRKIFNQTGNNSNKLPQYLLKEQMFCRAVGEDLARPIETLARPTKNVFTLAGSISNRLIRIGFLLDYLKHAGLPRNTVIDYTNLKNQLRYLAVEWQYRSVKIYPQLEGLLGAVAMQQQGYEERLIERIKTFHLAGTKRRTNLRDPETLLLVLVGKLDEAVSLFVHSTENGRSISSFDPFGVKPKIATAVDAAKALGLDLNDLKELMAQVIKANPDTIGEELALSRGYFWARIEKSFSLPRERRSVTI
ncbi:MAG: hypothetical protein PHD48_10170 [Alphaproteobacteria bacterium]|nr:hypothetical protein [Alphaproteobacteria bacterium]